MNSSLLLPRRSLNSPLSVTVADGHGPQIRSGALPRVGAAHQHHGARAGAGARSHDPRREARAARQVVSFLDGHTSCVVQSLQSSFVQ